jgi:hypothetical protein
LAASWHTVTLHARSLIASVHQKQDMRQTVGKRWAKPAMAVGRAFDGEMPHG